MNTFLSTILQLRQTLFKSALLYNIRILITFSGVVGLALWLQHPPLAVPLVLGVVAAALTDLDDRLSGRLINLLITLVCFFIASASVELLFPYPWLFIAGLLLSSCSFILLGALGQRYATIAFGALLIAIYTMLGTSLYDVWYQQPVLLLAGAVWYNLVSLSGYLLFPVRPLQDSLSNCYLQLAQYFEAKAMLFDPDEEHDFQPQLYSLAVTNGLVVSTLNQTKNFLLTRLKGDRGQRNTRRSLQYYFTVQDIHERVSSAHVEYRLLSDQLRYSDILFRFQRLLTMLARSCRMVSQSIVLHEKYIHDACFERAFSHLEKSLSQSNLTTTSPLLSQSLFGLFDNLRAISSQLSNIESEQTIALSTTDSALNHEQFGGLKGIWFRIRQELTPNSSLFRHAIRMGVVLCCGYAIIQLLDLSHGYWIMLTGLFVCQPNYSATKKRLLLRVIGTITGILLGLPVIHFVPTVEGQLFLIVISGVCFFAFRNIQYAHATMFITLLVLLCFNLLGEHVEDISISRILDTLIGCFIAWTAVTFIWPDWRFRNLSKSTEKCFSADVQYLDAIRIQYIQGRNNSLGYRIARRAAHNANAELATLVSNMSAENRSDKTHINAAFRLLCLNHTLLGYISALGAHRDKIDEGETLDILAKATDVIRNALNYMKLDLFEVFTEVTLIKKQISCCIKDSLGNKEQLVLQQMSLIFELLPELIKLKKTFSNH